MYDYCTTTVPHIACTAELKGTLLTARIPYVMHMMPCVWYWQPRTCITQSRGVFGTLAWVENVGPAAAAKGRVALVMEQHCTARNTTTDTTARPSAPGQRSLLLLFLASWLLKGMLQLVPTLHY